jgi:RNA polymerase sigma-70 factor (ECF subfamily)
MGLRVLDGVVTEFVGVALTGDGTHASASTRLPDLFDRHHQRLYRLARRLTATQSEAQDLVQETFLRIVRSPGSVPHGPVSEEAWLVRILINVCRDQWRRKGARQRLDETYGGPIGDIGTSSPEAAFIARTTVWRALQALTPRRRTAIILYELEGIGIAEIARLLGVSAITVRWHLSRGRQELARIIACPKRPKKEEPKK